MKIFLWGILVAFALPSVLHSQEICEWVSTAGGDWSDTINWKDGKVADGPGVAADLTASVGQNVKILVGSPARTVGYLYVGDGGGTPKGFTLAEMNDDPLTFDNNGANSLLKLGRPGGVNTKSLGGGVVTVDLLLKNSLDLDNISTFDGGVNINGALVLQGNISAAESGTMSVANITVGGKEIRITGAIDDGAGALRIVQNSPTSTLVLAGGNNYSAGTLVSSGTLAVDGKGNLGVGPVRVASGAALRLAADSPLTDTSDLILEEGATVELVGDRPIVVGRLSIDGGKTFMAPGLIGSAKIKAIIGTGQFMVSK